MLRTILFVLSGCFVTSCLLYENDLPKDTHCAPKSSVSDGDACRCDDDCKATASGGFCLSESDFHHARGYCSHSCELDMDCAEGASCHNKDCLPRCSVTEDCAQARVCWPVRKDVSVCLPFCDEPSDCESGNCNLYNGRCLPAHTEPKGGALGAACTQNGECRSDRCEDGHCETFCDPEYQRCPEGATCTKDGECVLQCHPTLDCDAATSCSDADAGVCESSN